MEHSQWVAGWGCAETVTIQTYTDVIENETFRYEIVPTLRGSALRVHLSNLRGTGTARVTRVYAARGRSGAAAQPGSAVEVTFGGRSGAEMAPGTAVVSDAIPFDVEPGQPLLLSLYIGEKSQLRAGHTNLSAAGGKFYASGDFSAADDIPFTEVGVGCPYVYLCGVDFLTSEASAAVVAFGDSLSALAWPDELSAILLAAGRENIAVIRKAIGGSNMLFEHPTRAKRHWGVPGVERFARDISGAGVRSVIVLHGVNDIIHPRPGDPITPPETLPTVEAFLDGYRTYVRLAHERGIRIYFGTLPPNRHPLMTQWMFEEKEALRRAANEWIRTSGEPDGVIDFEAALADPDDPGRLGPAFDRGDALHPSAAGSKRMAEIIPLDWLNA